MKLIHRLACGLFDPRTAEIKEFQLPTKFLFPYDVATNADASEVWTGSMLNDLVARLDTKTGKFTEYLLPLLRISAASTSRTSAPARPRCGPAATTAPRS